MVKSLPVPYMRIVNASKDISTDEIIIRNVHIASIYCFFFSLSRIFLSVALCDISISNVNFFRLHLINERMKKNEQKCANNNNKNKMKSKMILAIIT